MKRLLTILPLCIVLQAQAEDTIPTKQAKEKGIKTCLHAVEKMSNFIADGNHGASSVWNSKVPDESAFSTVIERTYSDGSIFTSLTVARTKSDHCYSEYEKIIYFEDNCMATAQKNYKEAEYKGEVNKNVTSLSQNGVDIFLMPAGNGCVVMRKEILMDVPK
ncbi:hypothetical protein [Aeromonas fluvialis]|uniref:hypothetical protein n=1 Tax=Aeromonas fluvialis TaxID=591962 RepID=UPI0006945EEB|nr:hypothetical protein [Aeromonas fluvialis]